MLFNSIEFAIFLPIVFLLYWFVTNWNLKFQNALIVASSFFFYGWWDWRFLILMVFSASVDYIVGIQLPKTENQRKRKLLLLSSVLVNLGILGFFKYFNFFADNFVHAFSFFGYKLDPVSLKVVLPVGISFYTFQAMSYTIDVYLRKLQPTHSIVNYFAFISFFPQLVAGPIERATNLLPQFYRKREFNYQMANDGMRQILWGLFKKIVIADNCAGFANKIFDGYTGYSGSTIFLGAVFFAFQIYCDFSGYSDIAIGIARLFGFQLMRNFAFPYFSRDMAEFWRRWHISLTTWFRDYVYFPLGGSKGTTYQSVRNTFIIFLVSGFWHGANWTFIFWGLINAVYFIPLLLLKQNRRFTDIAAQGKILPGIKEIFQISITFFLACIAWVFFRAENVSQAFFCLSKIFSFSFFSKPIILPGMISTITLTMLMVLLEWLQREKQHALEIEHIKIPRVVRWVTYYGILFLMLLYAGKQQEFIYFQF